jgi:hypothetical protein
MKQLAFSDSLSGNPLSAEAFPSLHPIKLADAVMDEAPGIQNGLVNGVLL